MPEKSGAWMLVVAGVSLALATALGAFGSHALEGTLTPDRIGVYETGVRYQFVHSLGLLGIGIVSQLRGARAFRIAAALIVAGIVLFSGTLYALTFGAPRILGGLTAPLGGLCLIAGWISFAVAAGRSVERMR